MENDVSIEVRYKWDPTCNPITNGRHMLGGVVGEEEEAFV
jgi:hypothetical protein